jgi:hypothetical protein
MGSTHHQQEKHSTQCYTPTFSQFHLQVVDALLTTLESAQQRPHKIHTSLFFHPEAHVWILQDKHGFIGRHHQLRPLRYDLDIVRAIIGENALQISSFAGGSGNASGSKQGGIEPTKGRPSPFA